MFHITWGAGLCSRLTTAICPQARPVGVGKIKAITTLGPMGPLATMGMTLNVGIWHLTQTDVEQLDRYRTAIGMTIKSYTRVTVDGTDCPAQIHLARSASEALAVVASHIDMHRRGYDEWGFPQDDLENTLALLYRAAA